MLIDLVRLYLCDVMLRLVSLLACWHRTSLKSYSEMTETILEETMLQWNIKAKVMVFIVTTCVSVSCATGLISNTSSKIALQVLALTKLTAVRSAKNVKINTYLQIVKVEIQTVSENRMTIEATGEFKKAVKSSSLQLSELGAAETPN